MTHDPFDAAPRPREPARPDPASSPACAARVAAALDRRATDPRPSACPRGPPP